MASVLMAEMNICAICPKPNLSKPSKGHPKFPYLLRNKRIWLPNQVWAIDITYVPYKGGHLYLTAIIDWYSRLIVGWTLSDTLEVSPVIKCVKEAYDSYGIPAIQNSDQGSHFSSNAYIELLEKAGVAQSMDGKARWVNNVIIERWFRTLKTEYIHINEFDSPRELKRGIKDFVEKYNAMRGHESLDYATPKEVWHEAYSQAA
jgi:putative transposase